MKLLKFSAHWCQPCHQLSKILYEIELPCELVEVDVDSAPKELLQEHGVRSVPTLVLIDDEGNMIKKSTGAKSKQELEKFLEF